MSISTRREFLTTTSLAFASSALKGHTRRGQWFSLPSVHAALPAQALLPDRLPASELRAFALCALDAAREAGAQYADVRVAEQVNVMISAGGGAAIAAAFWIMPQFMYGVRVRVGGGWAFAHGVTPTIDAVTTAARDAVVTARGYARLNTGPHELAPAPVVTGEWETPMVLDPFAVPLGDQTALISACMDAASRVRNASAGLFSSWTWNCETRVFASSEGSLVTQTFRTFRPDFVVEAGLPGDLGKVTMSPLLWPMSGGYECVTRPGLQDEIKRSAEEAAWYLSLPRGELDVGRYPVVFTGATLGATIGRTLGRALELDRVLGEEAGASGGSYLGPPADVMGTAVASPLFTMTANRALPSATGVKWDDDGVEPVEVPLITQGRLVGYVTSRQTASALAAVPSARRSVSSTGCAVAPNADEPVLVRMPHCTVAPSSMRTSLEDLCKEVSRGVLLRYARYVATDQRLVSGLMFYPQAMLEIVKGKIVRRLEGNTIQFTAPRFWQSLVALGDATTVQSDAVPSSKGQPEQDALTSASAPAALFKDIDVVSTKSRL